MTEGPHLESQADRYEGEEENWSQGCKSHGGELVTVLLVVVVVSRVYSSIGITITMHCLALSWAEGRVRLPSTRSTVRILIQCQGIDNGHWLPCHPHWISREVCQDLPL